MTFQCQNFTINCSLNSLWCEECGEKVACYKGETGRNSFSRGLEHLANLESRDEAKSVLWLHSIYHHQRRENVPYDMRVTGEHRDSLDRQVTEIVVSPHSVEQSS